MTMQFPAPTAPHYERPVDTCRRLGGMGLSTLYAHIDRGLFVKPVALSRRFVVFPTDEVDAIINARVAGADDDAVKAIVSGLMDARKQRA